MMMSSPDEMVECSEAHGNPLERELKKQKRGELEEFTKEKSQEWTDASINALLDMYEEKWNHLKRGNLRSRDWSDLALQVSHRCHGPKAQKSPSQCKNKIESMKKKYRAEKQSKSTTGGVPRWKYFSRLDSMLYGSSSSKLKWLPAPPDLGRQPAVIDLDSRDGVGQVESGDSGGQERSIHVFAAPCMTNMACSNTVHSSSCSLITAGKYSAHEFAPMPVTILVSRESGLQPLEETITLCTDQEFQEYLDNEDSYLLDETNKKVVWLSCMRNNRRYRLERKQGLVGDDSLESRGKVITLRSPSRSSPTFLRVKLRNTAEFNSFIRSMGFIGFLPFPSNKDMENLVLRYSELVDGSVCVGYPPAPSHLVDDFQGHDKDKMHHQ